MFLSVQLGPIAAALVNKFGCRPVAIAGAAFASLSFFVSTFSPNIECMIVFYGFCGGRNRVFFLIPAMNNHDINSTIYDIKLG